MRPLLGALSVAAILINASASQAQRIMPGPISDKQTLPSEDSPPPPPLKIRTLNPSSAQAKAQPAASSKDIYSPRPQSAILLSDAIGPQRSISSFSSFTRLHASTEELLSDKASDTTVLAPLNSAIDALPRKPWESPSDYESLGGQAYDGSGGQDRANRNLERFVQAHFVRTAPWEEGKRARTLAGREVWWEGRDGKRVIMPDGVEVERVASRVANGELWFAKGVLNYE